MKIDSFAGPFAPDFEADFTFARSSRGSGKFLILKTSWDFELKTADFGPKSPDFPPENGSTFESFFAPGD